MFPSQSRPFVPFRSFYVDLSQPPRITHQLLTTLPRAEPPGAEHQRQQERRQEHQQEHRQAHRQEHQLDLITSLLTIIANGLCIIVANVPLIIIHYSTADQRKHQVLDNNNSTNWP